MRGRHLIMHWSRTQSTVALSSCEVELNGICKACQESRAGANLAQELGQELVPVILTDASAARGVVLREGSGKIKHLEVRQLWVQELAAKGKALVKKICRSVNVSDMLTHHWSGKEGCMMLARMGVVTRNADEVGKEAT